MMRYPIIILAFVIFSGCFEGKGKRDHAVEINEFDTCRSKDCLSRAIKADPRNVRAHSTLGALCQSEYNYQEAIKELNTAIDLDPSYNMGFPYRDRANCKNNLLNDTGAVNDMNEAIKYNPTERYFYVDRGDYVFNLAKYNLALDDYNKALDIFDRHTQARIGRAKALVKMGQYKNALEEYKYLKEAPEFSNYDFYYRGIAKLKMNDKKGACADWKTAAKFCKEARDSLDKYCDRR